MNRSMKKKAGEHALVWAGQELGVGASGHVEDCGDLEFLVVKEKLKEKYAAFVFDETGWWDHAYWHAEGWY